jgi:hypothetical protein
MARVRRFGTTAGPKSEMAMEHSRRIFRAATEDRQFR